MHLKKIKLLNYYPVRCLGVSDSRGHYVSLIVPIFFFSSFIIKITLLPLMLYCQNFLSGGSVFYNACQLC
jgi:hypothetical protein